MHQTVLFFLLLWISGTNPASAVDVHTPAEVIVENGTTAILKCSFKSKEVVSSAATVSWTFRPTGSDASPHTIIYYGNGKGFPSEQYKDRLQFIGDMNKKDGSIQLLQIQFNDNGNYFCDVKNPPDVSGTPSRTELRVVNPRVIHTDIAVDPPGKVVEGRNVTLTCSSDAYPPVDSYTWYKSTGPPGSSSLVQVGSGQVLVLASLLPTQTGLYFCFTGTSLGVAEVQLLMDNTDIDRVILRVVIGVKVLALLVFSMVLLWIWKQDSGMDKEEEDSPNYVNISGSVGRRQGGISSADQNTRVVEEESNM